MEKVVQEFENREWILCISYLYSPLYQYFKSIIVKVIRLPIELNREKKSTA